MTNIKKQEYELLRIDDFEDLLQMDEQNAELYQKPQDFAIELESILNKSHSESNFQIDVPINANKIESNGFLNCLKYTFDILKCCKPVSKTHNIK